VLVSGAAGSQSDPAIATDNAGGAIICWRDARTEPAGDLYAQRADSTGALAWATDGIAVCTAPGPAGAPVMLADGRGGAVVAWRDSRFEPAIYAQRIDASGQLGDAPPRPPARR
jgi:hypothetical protein